MYADPVCHVADRMAEAKREQLRFDQAWRLAMGSMPARPRRRVERDEYDAAIRALRATYGAWKRAYRGEEPLAGEQAAVGLAQLLVRDDGPGETLNGSGLLAA